MVVSAVSNLEVIAKWFYLQLYSIAHTTWSLPPIKLQN